MSVDPFQFIHDNGFTWDDVNALAAILEAGDFDIVRSTDLLDIARVAGDDLSDIDHPSQIVFPTLVQFVARAVQDLRDSYDECLDLTEPAS